MFNKVFYALSPVYILYKLYMDISTVRSLVPSYSAVYSTVSIFHSVSLYNSQRRRLCVRFCPICFCDVRCHWALAIGRLLGSESMLSTDGRVVHCGDAGNCGV